MNRRSNEAKKRPPVKRGDVTTPLAETMIALLGPGMRHESVLWTRDETAALNKLYGFVPEKPNKRPPRPEPEVVDPSEPPYKHEDAKRRHAEAVKRWEAWTDPLPLMQAGADRNMARHAMHDGLRLIAWLAKHVPPGTDPLKTLIQMAALAGWDVSPEDMTWAEDEEV